jgi:hypothetical protein
MPPVAVRLILPVPPKQETLVIAVEAVSCAGCVKLTEKLLLHPDDAVTVTL